MLYLVVATHGADVPSKGPVAGDTVVAANGSPALAPDAVLVGALGTSERRSAFAAERASRVPAADI